MLLLVVLALTSQVFAQSNPPSPTPIEPNGQPENRPSKNESSANGNLNFSETRTPAIEVFPPQTMDINTGEKDQQRHDDSSHEGWLEYLTSEWWLVYLTGLLVFATILLMRYTARLWHATVDLGKDSKATSDRQANEMEESLRIANATSEATIKTARTSEVAMVSSDRAYIFMTRIDYKWNDDELIIMPRWKNGGNTPANNMLSFTNWECRTEPMPDDFDFPDNPTHKNNEPTPHHVGPKTGFNAPRAVFVKNKSNDFSKGGVYLYIWGWADYNDVFEGTPRHRTEFCRRVEILPVLPTETYLGYTHRARFRIHSKYNGADDDCIKQPAPYVKE